MIRRIASLLLLTVMLMGALGVPISTLAAGGADNYPLNSIVIKIEDIVTHQMLGGARFEIYYSNDQMSGGYGTLVATVDSDGSGVIVISGIPAGYYIVRQTVPPNNYHLSIQNEQHCYIKPDGTSIEELVFSNYRYGGLVVILNDKDTGLPVSGATFSVTDVNNKAVGNHADGIYTTDSRGEFFLENLPAGDYKITQLTAAQGYALDSSPSTRTMCLQHTNADQSVFMAQFSNSPLGMLLVNLKEGAYVVSEIKAPQGYQLDSEPQTIVIEGGKLHSVEFLDKPLSGIEIIKTDSVSKLPLAGATFKVERPNGEVIGTFKTDVSGKAIVPDLESGTYIVSGTNAPDGYILHETPKTVTVVSGRLTAVEFTNKPLSGIQIIKLDAQTNAPLSGASFIVERTNGERIGSYKTDRTGKIIVDNLTDGAYIISEIAAPDGYTLDETPKNVIVTSGKLELVEFTNKPHSGIEIIKLDAISRVPLMGAEFVVERDNGEKIGNYRTDITGKITVPDLPASTYIVSEINAPAGYMIDEAPKTVIVKSGKLTAVEFTNNPFGSLTIKKTDKITGKPLSDAHFEVYHGNDLTGEFETGADGTVNIPSLESGSYTVKETRAPSGYVIDTSIKTVEVKAAGTASVTIVNAPLSGIEILKTDAVTNKALTGATFEITKADGEKVGQYKTDRIGKIIVSGLTDGVYIVSEIAAPNGYERDELPRTVTVKSGKLESLEFQNKPYSGIEIIKVDYFSKVPLSGAAFKVEKSNGEKIGEFTTDNTGKILVPNLAEGVYIVSEITAPQGYTISEQPKTITVKAGKLESVTFADKPLAGIEILKIDKLTNLPLSGATFEIKKSNGETAGTFKTDKTGKIIVPDLADGTYIVAETIAPDGYQIDEVPLAGAVYDIKLADGQFVAGNILDGNQPNTANNSPNKSTSPNGDITGSYTTDANGRILINGLDAGQYTVTERKTPDGYQLDTAVYNVTVVPGKLATLQLQNTPLGGIRLTKVDSLTKKPIHNVEVRPDRA